MLEDTATTEEDQSSEEVEIDDTSVPTHPYDMPVNGLCSMLNPDMKKK